MTDVSSIRDIIGLWPQRAALAEDLNAVAGREAVTTSQVQKWAEKASIPAKFHGLVIRTAALRGHAISTDTMVAMHDAYPAPVEGARAAE